MSAPATNTTHPLHVAAPALGAALGGVTQDKAAEARRTLGILAVQGTNTYTHGEVWGPLYGALQNNTAADPGALEKAAEGLRDLEADGMLLLARLEGRVTGPEGLLPVDSGMYRNHRWLVWKLRAFLAALADPYPEQLLDVALCLRNGGFEDSAILAKLSTPRV